LVGLKALAKAGAMSDQDFKKNGALLVLKVSHFSNETFRTGIIRRGHPEQHFVRLLKAI
jgi:hypothetical protein